MMPVCAVVCACGVLLAQTPPNWEDAIRKAMGPSLEKQRASIQKQAAAAANITAAPAGSFFALDWPTFSAPNFAQPVCDPVPPNQLSALIDQNATKEGVKPELIRAVIEKESANRPCAISPKGAQGLMQLMPDTAQQFAVADPFDPKQNVEAGTKLLKQLLTKYNGDVSLALSAYNAGSGRVDQEGGIPQIRETINYVADILAKLPKWR
jgi:soluble lytic murein transglycosylase-like protein